MENDLLIPLITMVTALLGMLAGVTGIILAILGSRKTEQIHLMMNSRLDELIASRELNAEHRGHKAGMTDQKNLQQNDL